MTIVTLRLEGGEDLDCIRDAIRQADDTSYIILNVSGITFRLKGDFIATSSRSDIVIAGELA